MRPRLLVLQASSLCNLDCAYCYVPDRQNAAMMSEATLRAALGLALSRHGPGDSLRILWHAGEPLAAGLAFFERASDIIRELTPAGVRVTQAMQTNGTLVDDAWCRFFLQERVQVGISVDGPAHIHDRYRRSFGDRPTHALAERAIGLFKEHGVALNGLAVLTPCSLDHADDIFDYFAGAGFNWLGFNLEETEGVHASAVGRSHAAAYRAFMTRLYARWRAAGRRPEIREFSGMGSAIAAFRSDPSFVRRLDDLTPFANLAVTRDGEISTFSPELAGGTGQDPKRFSLGNVHTAAGLEALQAQPAFQRMALDVARGVERCRAECDYFPVCGGGAPSNKFHEQGTFDWAETAHCTLHRKVLAEVVADGMRLAEAQRIQPARAARAQIAAQ